ncbi:MAG: class I SAM-dependent methyltransferase [Patescibacteria group bacterium]
MEINVDVKKLIKQIHCTKLSVDDDLIDSIIGLNYHEQEIDQSKLIQQLGKEQYIHEPTPYAYLRQFINFLNPDQDHTIYDLGSGYGRVLIYCGIVNDARFKGIEIVHNRIAEANLAIKRLKLKNVEFFEGNVLNYNLDDGDIFFLFNPFSYNTLWQVGLKLKRIATKKPIKIATWGGTSNDFFDQADWLNEITPKNQPDEFFRMQFFESKEPIAEK